MSIKIDFLRSRPARSGVFGVILVALVIINASAAGFLSPSDDVAACWDKSSLVFEGSCGSESGALTAKICNSGEKTMTVPAVYEVWFNASGDPKDGAVVFTGQTPLIAGHECATLSYIAAAAGQYAFKAYQQEGHPGIGYLWSDACSSSYEPVCGNGILDQGEQCDTEVNNGLVCEAPYGETCSYCSESCATIEVVGPNCGDGVKNGSEECDEEDGVGENQACSADCRLICRPEEPKTGHLVVKKIVSGGNTQSADWLMHVGNDISFPGSEAGVKKELEPGMYQVGETGNHDNYILTYSGDCGETGLVSVAAGEEKTCVLTNTYHESPSQIGTLTVKKMVVGGQAASSDWTMHVGDGISFPGSSEGETRGLALGDYAVTESGGPVNYFLSYSGDCDENGLVSVTAGSDKTCILTNTYDPVCGNGIVEENEACDAGERNGLVCEAAYGQTCSYCASECSSVTVTGPYCGDGAKNGEEACDGSDPQKDGYRCNAACAFEAIARATLFPTNRGGGVLATPPQPVVSGSAGEPRLAIEKTAYAGSVNPGERNIAYRIIVGNHGNLTAFDAVVTDILPAGFTFAGTGLAIKEWRLGDLAPGETKELTVLADASVHVPAGTHVNTATVSAANHGAVQDDAAVAVRQVEVKGIGSAEYRPVLPLTGFSAAETAYLAFGAMVLLYLARAFGRSEDLAR